MSEDNKREDIKFFTWEMGRFLKHFLISVILFAFCGGYVIVLVEGRENLKEANNYLSFILTIIASVLSIVSLVLSYYNTRQAQEMQKEFGERLYAIQNAVTDNYSKKTGKDWRKRDES